MSHPAGLIRHGDMKTIFLLAILAAGCSKKGADCDAALSHSITFSGMEGAMADKMKAVGIQHCKDDHWPEAALTCMVEAKTQDEAQACYGKLSAEQQDKMNKAAMAGSK